MQITGIVCEYNPFHLGHSRQLEAARRAVNEDCAVVCVMSGNFVQRGEPAILSKAARAEMAVRCGADLAVELPLPWALSSAERFADGGVAILEALGADSVAFGAECPDVSRLRALAEALLREETGALIREKLRDGVSYAAARERALWELAGPDAALLREPNNILAELEVFTGKNIDGVIELASRAGKPDILSYLMNYKNAHIGIGGTDYEL